MNGAEELAKKLYEACLSGEVETLNALIQKDRLILDRVSSIECFFNETPLHVAVLRGHLEFTKALLTQKPGLATELDSRRFSPLHLASTEGHFEIVRELLRVNPDVCMVRDQDGRVPLHLAVMKGRVEIIGELLRAKPDSVQCKLERGETLLHLCVKYNRLEALKTLVQYMQSNGMESLLNSRDDDGNTILHIAAELKQKETIKYLLGIECVKNQANDQNQKGFTVLDVVERCPNKDSKTMEIRELLLKDGVHRSVRGRISAFWMFISVFWTTYVTVDDDWLKEVRGHLITTAALTATMAYQSIMSPPGGFWQETKNGQIATSLAYSSPSPAPAKHEIAGQAVMDTPTESYYKDYEDYLALNTVVLGASLSTIMLAMIGFPTKNKFLTWLLIFTVYFTISCMAAAYVIGVGLISPRKQPSLLVRLLLLGWMALCAFVMVLHSCRFLVWLCTKSVVFVMARYACRFLVWLCKKSVALVKAYCKVSTSTSQGNLTESHKGAGNLC